MKIAAGALALLVVAATASGDSNTYNYQDNGTAKFNTRSGQIVDASGNAKVVDADRDRDYVLSYDNIIADTTAVYMADSSAIYNTAAAGKLFLLVRVTGFGVTANAFAKLAFEVRTHSSLTGADSVSTFIWDPTPRSQSTSESDSLTYGSTVAPTTFALTSTDIQAVLNSDLNVASKWGRPHTLVIPLVSTTGQWYWGEYTSIKYRVLASSNASLTYAVSMRGRP